MSNFADIFIDILKNMDKAKDITPGERAAVLQYLKNGYKHEDMVKKLKLSESVVGMLYLKTLSCNCVSTGDTAHRSVQGIQ